VVTVQTTHIREEIAHADRAAIRTTTGSIDQKTVNRSAAVALRLMHKRQRRLQRKLRRERPAPAPARPAQGSALPPAEPQGDK